MPLPVTLKAPPVRLNEYAGAPELNWSVSTESGPTAVTLVDPELPKVAIPVGTKAGVQLLVVLQLLVPGPHVAFFGAAAIVLAHPPTRIAKMAFRTIARIWLRLACAKATIGLRIILARQFTHARFDPSGVGLRCGTNLELSGTFPIVLVEFIGASHPSCSVWFSARVPAPSWSLIPWFRSPKGHPHNWAQIRPRSRNNTYGRSGNKLLIWLF